MPTDPPQLSAVQVFTLLFVMLGPLKFLGPHDPPGSRSVRLVRFAEDQPACIEPNGQPGVADPDHLPLGLTVRCRVPPFGHVAEVATTGRCDKDFTVAAEGESSVQHRLAVGVRKHFRPSPLPHKG